MEITNIKHINISRGFIVFLLFVLVFSGSINILAAEVNETASALTTDENSSGDYEIGLAKNNQEAEDKVSLASTESLSVSSNSLSGEAPTAISPETQQPIVNKIKVSTDQMSGALSYEFSLFAPTGINNFAPDLSLVYNSQNQNNANIFGYGWTLNIPSIERINKDGIEKIYEETNFSSSISGDLKSANLTDGVHGNYGAKIDNGSFLNYQFNYDDSWSVRSKDGKIYTFGLTTDSRQDNASSTEKVFKWMLSEVHDANNNFLRYEYYKEAGQIYPAKITYTGHGADNGIFSIEFSRETRPDVTTLFNTGFKVENKYRINEIDVKVNGDWIRKYNLAYSQGDYNVRSLLTGITESAKDESGNTTILPGNQFFYSHKNTGWTESANWRSPVTFVDGNGNDTGARLADVNGDGLPDILHGFNGLTSVTTTIRDLYLNTGAGWVKSSSTIPINFIQGIGGILRYDTGARLADVNGDGLVDIITNDGNVYLNANGSWQLNSSWKLPTGIVKANLGNNYSEQVAFADSNGNDLGTRLVDVNGDGLPDIVQSYIYYGAGSVNLVHQGVYINNGQGWTKDSNYNIPTYFVTFINVASDEGVRFMDVNGDGLPDIVKSVKQYGGPWYYGVYLNKGDGTGWAASSFPAPQPFLGPPWYGGTELADVNGDGLDDTVHSIVSNNGGYMNLFISGLYFNTGLNWSNNANWAQAIPVPFVFDAEPGFDTPTRLNWQLTDINGDSLPDFVGRDTAYLANPQKSDLLSKIVSAQGGEVDVDYDATGVERKNDGSLANPHLSNILMTVKNIISNDGLGNLATTSYEYRNGLIHYNNPFDRKFAGFSQIIKHDPAGNTTINYYHQGNDNDASSYEQNDQESKIGRIYRSEIYNASGELYEVTVNKWDNVDLGNDRNFVKLAQTVEEDYDGLATHRDKAESYIYNDANGNLTQKIEWGEVNANNDGTFADSGSDRFTTNYDYAELNNNDSSFVSRITTLEQNGNQVKDDKNFYDNLDFGLATKGNPTKNAKWKSGNNYVDYHKEYNDYGLVTKDIDPNDNVATYEYDDYNLFPKKVTNALNQTTQYVYNYACGQIEQIIDPNGSIFQTIYDGFCRPLAEKQPDLDNSENLVNKKSYEYNDSVFPRSIKTTDYLRADLSIDRVVYFDGLDRPIQTRAEAEGDNQFSIKDMIYNPTGQVAKESLPYFSQGIDYAAPIENQNLYASYTFDALYRPLVISNSVGTTTNQYSNWQTTIIDPMDHRKDLVTDAYGNLIEVDEHNGNEIYQTSYQYDYNKNLVKITDALGNVRNFTYDGLGELTYQEDLHTPADNTFGAYNFVYDQAGNLTAKNTPNGDTINYTYDELNRETSEDNTATNGVEVLNTYDNCLNGIGRLCVASSIDISTVYEYNALGLIKSENRIMSNGEYETRYFYDRQGNQTEIIYPNATIVKYEYDSAGLAEKVWKKGANDQDFEPIVSEVDYNPLRQVSYQKLANNVEVNYNYNENQLYRLTNKTSINLSDDKKLQDLSYAYDQLGNITGIIDASDTQLTKTSDFSYDDLNRLTRAQIQSQTGSSTAPYVETYSYDAIGNILNKSDSSQGGQAGDYTYAGEEGNSYANPHAVTAIAGRNYVYDRNGNLTSDSIWSHAWDYKNELISSTNGTSTLQYLYDTTGNRIAKITPTQSTYYPNKYFEYDSEESRDYIYLNGQKIATLIAPLENSFNACQVPSAGDWTLTESCTLANDTTAPGDVIINDGSVLTVASSSTLYIDLKNHQLLVKQGGGVLIKQGGAIRQGVVPIDQNNPANNQLIFHLTDHLTGTNLDTDQDGNILEAIDYYPFGSARVDDKSGSYENNYKYTGKELDEDTGLYYYGARYYDAEIGRWAGEDPASQNNPEQFLADPQQLNFYSYVRNNPLIFIDPTGKTTTIYVEAGNIWDGLKSTLGHSFLDINGKTYSWAPGEGRAINEGTYGQDLGIVSTDYYLRLQGKNNDSYSAYTFDTTPGQEGKIKNYYQSLIKANTNLNEDDNTTFDTAVNNCTDVVVDALKSGNVVSEDFNLGLIQTPNNLRDRLNQKYDSQNNKGWLQSVKNWWNQKNNNQIMNIEKKNTIKTNNSNNNKQDDNKN